MTLESSPKNLKWGLALIAFAILHTHVSTVSGQCTDPLVIKGKKFFNSKTGNYFPLKGINYYPRPNSFDEVTVDAANLFTEDFRHVWERDIAQFQALGVNAIRLYAVNPSLDNDAVMCALQSAGIYVLVGLAATCEGCAITKDAEGQCYPTALKGRGQYIIKVFSKYPNVIGFDAGNEINLVAPPGEPEVNAACQKKFVRDMRAFISSCSAVMRQIPVGAVLADVERDENALYYGCHTDPTDELESTEWYGINTYVHCDGTATSIDQLAGYRILLSDFSRYGLSYPVILTEFGCLSPSFPTIDGYEAQRNFLDVEAQFSSDYREEFAGGFVFEYSTEKVYAEADSPYPFTTYGPGNYGVGYFMPENCNDMDIPCEYVRFPQFASLTTKFGNVDTSGEPNLSTYTPAAETVPACPATFPLLSQYDWSAVDSIEDLVCWDDGGFSCPNTNCGSTPIQSVQTDPPNNAPSKEPANTEPESTTSPTSEPTLTPGNTGAPSAPLTAVEDNEPIVLPTDNILYLNPSSGSFLCSRTIAIISTTCMLLAFFSG